MFHLTLALLASGALADTGSETGESAYEGPWTVADGYVLAPTEGHFTEAWGISAPTIAHDGTQYVMFFENKMDEEPEDTCKSGYLIGRATSPDGVTWTLDEDPALEPVANTYYSCVLSQPTVLLDDVGTWHMWFAAGQYKDPCPEDTGTSDAEEPAWGCETQTGIGYAWSSDGESWTMSDEPIVNRVSLGHPTALMVEDTYQVLFTDAADDAGTLNLVTSADGSTWTEVGPVVEPGLNDWMDDRLSGGAATCDLTDSLPYEVFFTGKNVDGANGFGKVVSSDLESWFFEAASSPFFTEGDVGSPWETDNWSHWEVLAMDNGADVAWFSIKDDTDNVRKIGIAATADGWTEPLSRVCAEEEPSDTEFSDTDTEEPTETDTEEPTETDTEPTDTDEPTESDTESSDTDTGGDPEGCNCSATAGAPALIWGLSLLLPFVYRRRR